MSKTKVIYRDVAVGAEDSATVHGSGQTSESKLQSLPTGVSPGNVLSLERNRWLLDGAARQYYKDSEIAFWSTEISGNDCKFSSDPVISISFSQQFSSTGVSIVFDDANDEWCDQINVKWYQGAELKADQDFKPDGTQYFCSKRVESYDKIVVTLKKTFLPHRRAKVNRIVFGVLRSFGMDQLRNATITNQMNESSIELPVSTFRWTLDSLDDVDYLFQLKQPVEVQNDGKTLGVYYISGSNRNSKQVYQIDCKDALGVLDDTPFSGNAYLDGISAKTLLETLCSPFHVEYADDIADTTLKGIIQSGTMRAAIQQVIFAWGVCLATDGGDKIRVFHLPETATEIQKDRTFPDTVIKTDSIVTKVTVVAHTYAESSDGAYEVAGKKYADTETEYSVSNPDVVSTDKINAKSIKSATLVSTDIGQETAQRVYDYYLRRNTTTARIVYAGEKLGECVSIYTPWGAIGTGILNKMSVTLSNTVIYKAETKSQGVTG